MSAPDSSNLGQHTFLSWARRGAASLLSTPDPLTAQGATQTSMPARATVAVGVTLKARKGSQDLQLQPSQQLVQLYGPSDLAGVDLRHVTTIPVDHTMNFEPNYFAGIKFDEPDFLWRFTPAAPNNNRLRPWLVLIVLANSEFAKTNLPPHPLPSIQVTDVGVLPPLEESWAWAHVHVAGALDGGGSSGSTTLSADTLVKTPGKAISRLLCPQQLQPDTAYTAFLVPAFDVGVQAGLGTTTQPEPGSPPPQASPAWQSGGTGPMTLPYFYSFEFHTSDQGDFETLARRLQARTLPPDVGTRLLGVDDPHWGIPSAGGPLLLGGALRAPSSAATHWPDVEWPSNAGGTPGSDKGKFQVGLQKLINVPLRTEDRLTPNASDVPAADPAPNDPNAQDPTVAPPIYGRWHAAVQAVDPKSPLWLNQLNMDPRTRAIAGLGTQVVRQQRAQLMTSAWHQIAGVDLANQLLRQAQLTRATLQQVYTQHFVPAATATLLLFTSAVHGRILVGSRTVRATIEQSQLPSRALSAAFRRVARPLGPVRRRQGAIAGVGGSHDNIITRLNSGEITLVPPVHPPEGMVSVDQSTGAGVLPSAGGKAADGGKTPEVGAQWWLPLSWLLLVVGILLVIAAPVLLFVAGQPSRALAALVLGVVLIVAALLLRFLALGHGRLHDLLLRLLLGLERRIEGRVAFADLTPQAFAAAPPHPNFKFVDPRQPPSPATTPPAGRLTDSPDAHAFRLAATPLATYLQAAPSDPPPPRPADLAHLHATVLARLDPTTTVRERMSALVHVDAQLGWKPADSLTPIMAAPDFPQPMYKPLRDWSQEFLLPGLNSIPAETVTVLEADHAFIEAYMVGLNQEMGRQLLWHEYPTDQRGSYFRQFWEVNPDLHATANAVPVDLGAAASLEERLKDIPPIHTWPRENALCANKNGPVVQNNLVLLVRGELLRRYPDAVIYACPAAWDAAAGKHVLSATDTTEMYPLFRGTLSPDVTFFGFDLTAEKARGSEDGTKPGWFFILQQHASEPAFGLEPAPTPYSVPAVTSWDKLNWANLAGSADALAKLRYAPVYNAQLQGVGGSLQNTWGQDAAQMALITMRMPARVAIHAKTMLHNLGSTSSGGGACP